MLDVVQSKITPVVLRPGIVSRPALVNRLRREPAKVIAVTARAGYGKSTLLAQWAAAESRDVAWITIDNRDNDPLVFLKHVLAVFDRIEPLDPTLTASVADGSSPSSVVGGATDVIASCPRPFLLVLDNADLLRAVGARLLARLIAEVPDGSTVALGSRRTPLVVSSALRGSGRVREIGVGDLALSNREAQLLLRATDPDLTAEAISELIAVCEGWPAALYLAALALGDRTLPPAPFTGSHRHVAEYMQAESLSQLHPQDLRFLRRASILDELTAQLCDSVLHDGDSGAELEQLARSDLVVPLGGKPGWYRWRRLFRDLLLRELVEDEPQLVPTLHRRAASWYERAGRPEPALAHTLAAGDADRAASIIAAFGLRSSSRGLAAGFEAAIARLTEAHLLGRYPAVALLGSWIHAWHGRAADAETCLALAERAARRKGRDSAALRPRIAVVRAALCRSGPRRMLADARIALNGLPRECQWYPVALNLRGSAALLLGSTEDARFWLAEAAQAAAAGGLAETRVIAISQLSLLAREELDLDAADLLAADACEIARSELAGHPAAAIALAAAADAALRHGDWARTRELVTMAEPLRPLLTDALPWLAVETRLALGRCYVRLRDAEAARQVVTEIGEIADVRPGLGVLAEQARVLRLEAEALGSPCGAPAGLTPAELRLLPLLATHLSFREIGGRLEISHNTVKTQAIAIYRKLGVSRRGDAVTATADFRSWAGA
jgi:LuxR family maltose regulon positive regulatory protein